MSKSIAETAHLNPFEKGDVLYLTKDYLDAPAGTRCVVNARIGSEIVSVLVDGVDGVCWVPVYELRLDGDSNGPR